MTQPCIEPGCPALVDRGRCAEHAAQRDAETHPRAAFYRTKRWKMTRRAVLVRDGFECQECHRWGDNVDHVVPLKEADDPYDFSNLQTLCSSCHSRKTASEVWPGRAKP